MNTHQLKAWWRFVTIKTGRTPVFEDIDNLITGVQPWLNSKKPTNEDHDTIDDMQAVYDKFNKNGISYITDRGSWIVKPLSLSLTQNVERYRITAKHEKVFDVFCMDPKTWIFSVIKRGEICRIIKDGEVFYANAINGNRTGVCDVKHLNKVFYWSEFVLSDHRYKLTAISKDQMQMELTQNLQIESTKKSQPLPKKEWLRGNGKLYITTGLFCRPAQNEPYLGIDGSCIPCYVSVGIDKPSEHYDGGKRWTLVEIKLTKPTEEWLKENNRKIVGDYPQDMRKNPHKREWYSSYLGKKRSNCADEKRNHGYRWVIEPIEPVKLTEPIESDIDIAKTINFIKQLSTSNLVKMIKEYGII